jgi:hypothetical protein
MMLTAAKHKLIPSCALTAFVPLVTDDGNISHSVNADSMLWTNVLWDVTLCRMIEK